MQWFHKNIEEATLENTLFRQVLYTGKNMQLVLMTLKPLEEIGMEIHPTNDQFFRFEQGIGKCIIDGNEYMVEDGDAVIIPAGSEHNVINTSNDQDLKMYTLYAPPHHTDKTIHMTREDAIHDDEDFDGKTTE